MDKTHPHHTEAIRLWKQYQSAKTKDERSEALYLMGELKRKVEAGLKIKGTTEDLDQQTQSIIDSFQ